MQSDARGTVGHSEPTKYYISDESGRKELKLIQEKAFGKTYHIWSEAKHTMCTGRSKSKKSHWKDSNKFKEIGQKRRPHHLQNIH